MLASHESAKTFPIPDSEPSMPTTLLTDLSQDTWVEHFAHHSADPGSAGSPPWSVTKRVLRGGRRDGVDLIRVDNGALSFDVVPTRGMGLHSAHHRGVRLGWTSPIADGPVHPAFVNLAAAGGAGWLDGFDELLARCGLEHNGAPFVEGGATYPLHGRIANLPAHRVAVHIDDAPPHAITVEGCVDEARLFGPHLRMTAKITTVPGSNRLVVRDEFANLGDTPAELQALYHWNFGPPLLGEGARFLAPIRSIAPRDEPAARALDRFDTYGPPSSGSAEEVYFFELRGEGPEGRTLAMLRDREGGRAVVLRFATAQLPRFTLWKSSKGLKDGYVTGLEPATNYPNPKPFEKARGRVVTLEPGGTHVAEVAFEVLDSSEAVALVEGEIRALQSQGAARIHRRPCEPFTSAG